jgi:hypothetical protein
MGSMSKSYPNRQTLIIALICLGAVSATLMYIRPELLSQKSTWKSVEIAPTAIVSTDSNFTELAESEWKKAFNVTSPTLSETAKDSDKPLTLTDQLSRDFFTKYVELRQNSLSEDQKSVETAMNQTLSSAVSSAPKPKIYSLSNILISNLYDKNSLRAYGNNIGTIFAKSGPREDPTNITSEALEKDDMTILEELKPIITSYDKMTKSVLATSVPRPLASYHLELVNSLSGMLYVSEGLKLISTDPIQGMLALNQYVIARESMGRSLVNINDYLNKNEVYFSTTEPGIIFATVPRQ